MPAETTVNACESDPILGGLTPAQADAVTSIEGPVLVLAGPGSGKTTVVTRRVAYLVEQGIPAWQILALTFTNKAAGEMRERIDALVPPDVPGRRGLTVATFHAFCVRVLRRYADEAGLAERFSIYDAADQREALKRALAEVDLDPKRWTPAAVGGAISNAKNRLLDATGFLAEASDFASRTIAKVFAAYERILARHDALDFDDLLLRTARLLRERAAVREELQERYQYTLIDEYQDTNHAQFVIAHTLAARREGAANICVVGDPDQSIYGWRGADIGNILEFEEHYPDARVVPLGQNFRSTAHIVAAAAGLIARNRQRKAKELFTELDEGERPRVVIGRDEHHEARIVVDEMLRRRDEDGVAFKDMAVLYRMNALSRVLEEAFRDRHVPYVIARGTAFYERKEIKDALAYLRVIANPNDEISLRRIVNAPPRGIGKTTMDRIELHAIDRQLRLVEAMREIERVPGVNARAIAAVRRFVRLLDGWLDAVRADGGLLDEGSLAGLVERVIRESGLETQFASPAPEDRERRENLEELVSAAAQARPRPDDGVPGAEDDAGPPDLAARLDAFLESVALVSDADAIDPARGAVTLMTLHAAKGLEFDVVAIVGLEEGVLPHGRAASSEAELEEERRLCYVGMTRARRHLLLTRAGFRTIRGIRQRTIESAFARELPEASVERSDQHDDDLGDFLERSLGGEAAAGDPWGEPTFDLHTGERTEPGSSLVGATVRHARFGVGRVRSVMRRPAGSSARIEFESVGVKTLILEYAKLERLA